MYKRILCILALVLAMALVVACGRDNNDSDVTQDQDETRDETPAEIQDDTQDDGPEETDDTPTQVIDMGGRDIVFVASFAMHGVATDDPEPDPGVGTRSYFYERMMWDHLQYMRDAYNVTFSRLVVPWDEMLSVITTSVLAGAPAGDFFMLEGINNFAAINGDLIYAINDIASPDADIFNARTRVMPMAEFDDKIWTVHRREPNFGPTFMGVNLDIINYIGADNPVELYERGEWTFDRFLEIARLATRDTTGDGINDMFGIAGPPSDIILHFIAANAGYLVMPDDFSYGLGHPNTIAALETAETIFSEGLWEYHGEGTFGDWFTNFWSFTGGRSAFFTAATWALWTEGANLPFDYTAVPFPQGPNNPRGYQFLEAFPHGVGVARGTEDPEMVYHLFELMNAWHGDNLAYAYGQPTEYARAAFRTEACVQRMLEFIPRRRMDLGLSVVADDGWQLGWMASTFAYSFHTGGATIAQIIEENRLHAQSVIDDTFAAFR
ncbi:MAG: extracellular solute-binding protein [Defluviitaleaceae bacterium]|nr:extracellular solute-binding protein [Defluviitaleaceae bacterium]